MALTTSSGFKTWAGKSDSVQDTAIAAILTEAEALVANVLDRRLETAGSDVTEYYDGTGDDTIFLRGWPLVSLTSVSYLSSVSAGVAAFTAYDSDGYYTIAADGRLVKYTGIDTGFGDPQDTEPFWAEGAGNIKVVYQGGYTSSTIPADLVECIYEVISMILHGRDGTRTAPTEQALRDLIIARAGHYRRGML